MPMQMLPHMLTQMPTQMLIQILIRMLMQMLKLMLIQMLITMLIQMRMEMLKRMLIQMLLKMLLQMLMHMLTQMPAQILQEKRQGQVRNLEGRAGLIISIRNLFGLDTCRPFALSQMVFRPCPAMVVRNTLCARPILSTQCCKATASSPNTQYNESHPTFPSPWKITTPIVRLLRTTLATIPVGRGVYAKLLLTSHGNVLPTSSTLGPPSFASACIYNHLSPPPALQYVVNVCCRLTR